MSYQHLLVEAPSPGVAVLVLNRPQQRNAMNLAMQIELDQALSRLEADEAVRCIVITGAGDKAFSAGYDVREMQDFDQDKILLVQLKREPWLWHIADYPKPLIGAINGVAHGAGAIIASALDLRIGCSSSEFRYTAVSYGGVNNTWQLPQVVGWAKAKEFVLTAKRVGAQEALRSGLLNHLVADDELMTKAIELAAMIAEHPPEAVQGHKKLIHDNCGRSYEDAYRAENALMSSALRPRAPGELFADFLAKSTARS